MNTENYLRRIGLSGADVKPDSRNLKLLQRQHLLHVPFENLDIHWKRPILLDKSAFYQKIVGEKRGGFCYELNGLFEEFLSALGFQNKIISARVGKGNGEFGAEYDHLAILTRIGDEEFLVDVGFGIFTAAPLRFILDIEQIDANGIFAIRKFDGEYFEVVKKNDGGKWQSEYIFKSSPRDLAEFAGMCDFHQTSPESHFTRGKVCSLMLALGRKTLTDTKFIETEGAEKKETKIQNDEDFNHILACEFGIERQF